MKDFLIPDIEIQLAISFTNDRNQLMNALAKVDASDQNHFFKWMLSFWLGNTLVLEKIKSSDENRYKKLFYSIYQVYFCVLTLDKSRSQFHQDPSMQKMLSKIMLDIFTIYNYNYQLLTENPTKQLSFISKFVSRIQSIKSDHPVYQKEIISIKEKCLHNLNHGYNEFSINQDSVPLDSLAGLAKDIVTLNATSSSRRVLKMLSLVGNRHQFPIAINQPEFLINKLILQANDHVLLDGLHIKPRSTIYDCILIASVANKQSDCSFVSNKIIKLAGMVNAEVLYPNHRNHSQRSVNFSEDLDRLAEDIVCFAQHFAKQNKEIILYGMCGGAVQMILAAKKLQELGIKFKLTIDRFAQRYLDFVSPMTLIRAFALSAEYQQDLFSSVVNTFPLSAYYLFYLPFYLTASFTKINIDFSAIVKNLPEEDVLILQAKSSKHDSSFPEPLSSDYVVHPDCEMRSIMKAKRHTRKEMLLTLKHTCELVASNQCCLPSIQTIFSQLIEFSLASLNLISDDKLISKTPPSKPTDFHISFIGDFTTRSAMPIERFLNGFFKPCKKDWRTTFEQIRTFTFNDIFESITFVCTEKPNLKTKLALTEQLQCVFNIIDLHRDFLYQVSNRLNNTDLPDLYQPIKNLIESDFFHCLERKSCALPTKSHLAVQKLATLSNCILRSGVAMMY